VNGHVAVRCGLQPHQHTWVFSSPETGSLCSDPTTLNKHLKLAALRLRINRLGWHTLHHSCKSLMAAAEMSLVQMKDLMRHSNIETTMNVYGKTLTPDVHCHVSCFT